MKQYDVIIIGTGSANIIADAAIKQGLHIALIERSHFGGTCLNRGCIPTKILVTAADYIREIEESRRIGIQTGTPRIDWDLLSLRVWNKIGENNEVKSYYAQFPNVDIYEGTAFFTDKKTVQVTYADGTLSDTLAGDKIFLGVGTRTNIPAIPGLEDTGYIISETLFGDKWPKVPYESLTIIGGGPIGCEFSHAFSAAGTKVTVIQRNARLLPKEDEAVSAHILSEARRLGITVHVNADTIRVRQEGDQKILTIRDLVTGEEQEIASQEILVAPGTVSATDLLHLERTDVQTDRRGFIPTNEFLETTAEGIWALGDVNGMAPFRHKANYEAEIIAHNLFSNQVPENWRWACYETVPAVTYTYPQASHVGLTEADALKAGYTVKTGMHHYSSTAKGYAMGYMPGAPDDGFIKIIVDQPTGRILGVHIVGPQASILLQPFVNLLSAGRATLVPLHEEIASPTAKRLREQGLTRLLCPDSVRTIGETMVPHPALSEVAMWTQYYYNDN